MGYIVTFVDNKIFSRSNHYWVLCIEGGYDLLGRTKDQIRTTEQVNSAFDACTALKLDALVIIGGIINTLCGS